MAENHYSPEPREVKVAGNSEDEDVVTTEPSKPTITQATSSNSPFLPSPSESILLAVYPAILIFGMLFSVLSPETRNAPFDVVRQSHVPTEAPSYFARKDNLFNVLFVKRGWLWITASFFTFIATHPTFQNIGMALRASVRWVLVTGWWILVTQWCFGPPLVDRGFRITGGKCVVAHEAVSAGTASHKEYLTAAACRTAGGRWSGGHDISGHVFLLVLGSCFLLQEVVWVVMRAGVKVMASGDDRVVVMGSGAIKDAGTGSGRTVMSHERHLGVGGKFALGVVALSLWMLLMTAVYFHTWFEKFTGLIVASIALYAVYIFPRWIPVLRKLVGLPGV
ncbi:inositol phospholipid synthesis and fat-storage-inducing TM-domain-containing protein [Xylaria nigripes]|nr:inositol phospholipid synthesis and fat-storage-inducing TM-domain-containing protein [Xylaria nigripes]